MSRRRLEERLGHAFRDGELLTRALTHTSHARERGGTHNERLEFLGDAVLEMLMTEELIRRFPDSPEGHLSRIRAWMIRSETLAGIARELKLGASLRLGRGEARSGGRKKESLLADALEAVLGAIYLDAGMETSRSFVLRCWEPELARVEDPSRFGIDPKSELQERAVLRWKAFPRYTVEPHEHPEAATWYRAVVSFGEHQAAGEGSSKQKAQRAAARQALQFLREETA